MAQVVTPMAFFHVVILIALIYLWRKQKEGRRRLLWVAVPFILLTLLHSHAAGYYSVRSLESDYPPTEGVPPDAGVIVVLAGAVRAPDRVRTRVELGPSTLARCQHAVLLHKVAPDRPILVSGGPIDFGDGVTGASAMKQFLVSCGVPGGTILEEGRSRTTHENATECAKVLRERGVRKIVLVTHAIHMRRAAACFRAEGIEVSPSPCGHSATSYEPEFSDFIPDAWSVNQVDQAWHEWVGLAMYSVRGWI